MRVFPIFAMFLSCSPLCASAISSIAGPDNTLSVMVAGDSVGASLDHILEFQASMAADHPGLAIEWVGENCVDGTPVMRCRQAFGGYTFGQVDTSIRNSGITPEVVLLLAGYNNVAQGHSTAQTLAEFQSIADYFDGQNIPMVVASVTKLYDGWAHRDPLAQAWNDALEDEVASRRTAGHRIIFADNYDLPRELVAVDGLHLTGAGSAKVGEKWLPGLEEAVTWNSDANQDGATDILDFSIMLSNFHQSGAYTDGNFNRDERVDVLDFSILLSNYQQPMVSFVPEPAMAPWLLLLLLSSRRREL